MRTDFLLEHASLHRVSRREFVELTAKAGAVGALAGLGLDAESASAAPVSSDDGGRNGSSRRFTDEMFDVEAVLNGAWDDTAFYRRGDQRGTLREVTPQKTREALKVLDAGKPVITYNLGELMFNGFPTFPSSPPRFYDQRLLVLGYHPPPGYEGILQSPAPLGPNRISAHEERFKVTERSSPYTYSYQIGTQLDSLNHIGVGPVYYGGRRGPDIAETWGTSRLGSEHSGPIVTRGILLDVLGLKLAQGATDVLETAPNGSPHLAATYRITLEDLEAGMRQARIKTIRRGDVVLIRTGWNQLLEPHDPTSPHAPDDAGHPGHPGHQKYLTSEPGIYLREARWLASHRPAIVGADNWALEVAGHRVAGANVFPVHQELITHFGIRIGEAIVTDRLADDRVFEFVYIVTPQFAVGATAGNTPPCALGQPARGGRR
jgi:kynurenine formamidase